MKFTTTVHHYRMGIKEIFEDIEAEDEDEAQQIALSKFFDYLNYKLEVDIEEQEE
jgi:hypothetical protein